MYFVYILQSEKDQTFYTGFSKTPDERIQNHNWHVAKYTSSKTPYKLRWYGTFCDKKKALDFEKYLKSSSGIAFRNKHLV